MINIQFKTNFTNCIANGIFAIKSFFLKVYTSRIISKVPRTLYFSLFADTNFNMFLKIKILFPYKDVCNSLLKTWQKMSIALMCFIIYNFYNLAQTFWITNFIDNFLHSYILNLALFLQECSFIYYLIYLNKTIIADKSRIFFFCVTTD